MPNLSKILKFFAIELFLLLVLGLAAGTNLILRFKQGDAQTLNRSLFFIGLKNHPELNKKLLEAYQSINLEVVADSNLEKQILAASTKTKERTQAQLPSPLPTLSGSTLLKPNPASSVQAKRDTEIYTVRGGDTVARIAAAYGVSEYTIQEANGLPGNALIRPGQELKILPSSGLMHTVKQGETLEAIAKKYGVSSEDGIEAILEYNNIEIEDFISAGDELFIPSGIKPRPSTPERREYLAGLKRDDYKTVDVPESFRGEGSGLIWPMPGFGRISQYFTRRHRGIDIPGNRQEVKAASSGIVELSGWQRGYGQTIILNHGGGLRTRYGHGSQLFVSAGQQVAQGQTIMSSGDSGRSTGPHLHFEIIQNGTQINPLQLVRR